ncbi:hypothetical protein DESUT3_26310 [Desulfuromonas versatilis]|uniref:Thioredoxin domain-containing protein n=1 Tax=Desulfuromonas versatilis TaxID=2802975 RepID=A0ABM8HWS5_9BACT|nr:thioredoxin domain-containing protein [Desulfuromonas versatilis]BCR05562.1 hypothetical protein DESUT3_26310 [Desulfuromonas versatilis]
MKMLATMAGGLLALQLGSAQAAGTLDWQEGPALKLEEAPLAVRVDAEGQKIYVMGDGGNILVYSQGGELQGKIPAGSGTDGFELLPGGDRLLLKNSRAKTLKVVELSFVQEFDLSASPTLGPADAPVSVVVFDDFQCPYCARLAPQLKQLLTSYPEKVKVVFKNFPLRSHPFARSAAIAALAAHRQGRFWDYHDLLFANYNQLDDGKFQQFAQQLQLDLERFEQDRQDPELWALITRDTGEGVEGGVRGTPTVFVNGRLLKNKSPEGFAEAIEGALGRGGRKMK